MDRDLCEVQVQQDYVFAEGVLLVAPGENDEVMGNLDQDLALPQIGDYGRVAGPEQPHSQC